LTCEDGGATQHIAAQVANVRRAAGGENLDINQLSQLADKLQLQRMSIALWAAAEQTALAMLLAKEVATKTARDSARQTRARSAAAGPAAAPDEPGRPAEELRQAPGRPAEGGGRGGRRAAAPDEPGRPAEGGGRGGRRAVPRGRPRRDGSQDLSRLSKRPPTGPPTQVIAWWKAKSAMYRKSRNYWKGVALEKTGDINTQKRDHRRVLEDNVTVCRIDSNLYVYCLSLTD
jgi:hypothetical protein